MPSMLPSGLRLVLVLAAVALIVPAAGCQALYSGLSVPAHQTFVLGGDGPAFSVTALNDGPVAVAVVEQAADGTRTPRGTIAPGQSAEFSFAPGSTALVINTTGRKAHLDTTIRGGDASTLGMRYVPTTP